MEEKKTVIEKTEVVAPDKPEEVKVVALDKPEKTPTAPEQPKVKAKLKKKIENLKENGLTRTQLRRLILIAVAAGVLIVLGFWLATRSDDADQEIVPEEIIVEEEPEPEPIIELEMPEDLPEDEKQAALIYETAANRPRIVAVPSVGIYARVVTVGKVNGIIDTPKDIRLAGWYSGSVVPGYGDASVIDAHGGDLGNGIFKNLQNVQIGDQIIVEMGDGRRFAYTVEEVVIKPMGTQANNYMATVFEPVAPGVPTLTLITCTGKWVPAKQLYEDRLFVRAAIR